MALAEQFPEAYQRWVNDGGDSEEAFKTYMWGTGQLPFTVSDFAWVCDNMVSHQAELAYMGTHLPH